MTNEFNNGFNTASIKASSTNKIEKGDDINPIVQWSFAIASFGFVILNTLFWTEVLADVFNTKGWFYLFLVYYLFILAYPAFGVSMGYMWAKKTEYTRFTDTTSVIGGIAGQLAMNSGNLAKHYMSAIEAGRQMEMSIQAQVDSNLELALNTMGDEELVHFMHQVIAEANRRKVNDRQVVEGSYKTDAANPINE